MSMPAEETVGHGVVNPEEMAIACDAQGPAETKEMGYFLPYAFGVGLCISAVLGTAVGSALYLKYVGNPTNLDPAVLVKGLVLTAGPAAGLAYFKLASMRYNTIAKQKDEAIEVAYDGGDNILRLDAIPDISVEGVDPRECDTLVIKGEDGTLSLKLVTYERLKKKDAKKIGRVFDRPVELAEVGLEQLLVAQAGLDEEDEDEASRVDAIAEEITGKFGPSVRGQVDAALDAAAKVLVTRAALR